MTSSRTPAESMTLPRRESDSRRPSARPPRKFSTRRLRISCSISVVCIAKIVSLYSICFTFFAASSRHTQVDPPPAILDQNLAVNPRCVDEVPNRSNEFIRGLGLDALGFAERHGVIENFRQPVLIVSDDHATLGSKVICSRNLMIVPGLAISRAPRHHHDGLAHFQSGDDRSHSCVGHDYLGLLHKLPEFLRLDEFLVFDVDRAIITRRNLREDIRSLARARPVVDRANQPVKRRLGSHSRENHRTDPPYCGPSALARCGHCVSHRFACLPASAPDMESRSIFVMLSIQIVFAPSSRPTSTAKYPGAAPVETTTSGRSFATIQATLAANLISPNLFQRLASSTR